MATLFDSSMKFGLSLYQSLKAESEGKNVCFSPLSIHVALAMTHLGAKGKTAAEIESAMCFPSLKPEELHTAFKTLLDALEAGKNSCDLHVANRHFIEKKFALLDTFRQSSQDYYAAEAKAVDFVAATEAARLEINKWVADNTADNITELMKAGSLDSLTRLVLVNAVFFAGSWATPFTPRGSRPVVFHISKEKKANIMMMSKTAHFPHYFDSKFTFLELPYGNSELSMFVVLPQEMDGLDEVENEITAEKLRELETKTTEIEVMLQFPQFQVRESLNLVNSLKKLGMSDLFSDAECDLSGISGKRNLFVSAAVHEAYMRVDEQGTVATAATGIGISLMCMPPQIVVDHPFLFYIRDRKSGAVLFFGRFTKPMHTLCVCPCPTVGPPPGVRPPMGVRGPPGVAAPPPRR
ncbi:PREDICTED: leukocyte elastase inhibitor A-like [Priapulus caudatus]|uniref:Leukocyte elastase inhibitor A-like n=1 Tax=Priapulus caudatus TaxID=37621 RepID=A0ABM1DZ04_PRICU|nr:PREDICTED: leukocyte elastase inhibitor A-like [Priapulus caudatus]